MLYILSLLQLGSASSACVRLKRIENDIECPIYMLESNRVVRGAMHFGKKWRSALWLKYNAFWSKVMTSRIRPSYISLLPRSERSE